MRYQELDEVGKARCRRIVKEMNDQFANIYGRVETFTVKMNGYVVEVDVKDMEQDNG